MSYNIRNDEIEALLRTFMKMLGNASTAERAGMIVALKEFIARNEN